MYLCQLIVYLFACQFTCLACYVACSVTMSQDTTKLCDFSNTNNNDFISTPIPPSTSAEAFDINVALLNLVMKDQFLGSPNEDPASHLNNFVELCEKGYG